MFFPTTEYNKSIKIETRCSLWKTIKTLERVLTEKELKWFHDHPQFRHFFHMPELKNHKSMGMWMLLLRTVCTSKIREAWFLVNGTPIRYSIKEHGEKEPEAEGEKKLEAEGEKEPEAEGEKEPEAQGEKEPEAQAEKEKELETKEKNEVVGEKRIVNVSLFSNRI